MDNPILTLEERAAINAGRWFSSLSPSLRHDILRCAYVKRFKNGSVIATRGNPPLEWIACARGAVRVGLAPRGSPPLEWMACARGSVRVGSIAATGKQITLTYVEPGVWFGDVAFFDGNRRTHDAYARGDTTIVCVSKENFHKILSGH